MYIVKKKISGGEYYYIRQSVREGDKIKSKTIGYAGKTIEEAQRKLEELKQKQNNPEKNSSIDENTSKKEITIDELANFCKTKGFIFRSSDIYGGLSGFWDFGPLGVELFNNIKSDWWNFFVRRRDNMVGIEASVISHPRTWKASGHLDSFSDIAVVCKKCGKATKIDKS